MILDSQSEKILKYIIELDKIQPNMSFTTEVVCAVFSTINESVILDIVRNLNDNGFITAYLSDNGHGDIQITHKGRVYFETKVLEAEKQQLQKVTINNSSNITVGNNNTINVTSGITADEASRLIEQNSLTDKEALKEVIALLNDALENNKPIEPSKFKNIFSKIAVASIPTLINLVGGVVTSHIS